MRSKKNQVSQHTESFFKRYEYMFMTFAVGSIPVVGIVVYAYQSDQRWLAYVLLFVVIFAIVTSLIMTMLDDKPRSGGKSKREHHPVRRIQGFVQRYQFKRKNGQQVYEVKVHEDRTFTVSHEQWYSLDEDIEYIFYYANGQILSVEEVTETSMMPSVS